MGPARLAFGHGGRVRAVTSIDRTAYPRFRRSVPIKELQESFTPSGPEIEWARERTRTPEHLLALLLLLKAFQRLGCFPDLFEVPLPVVDHIRGVLGLASSVVGGSWWRTGSSCPGTQPWTSSPRPSAGRSTMASTRRSVRGSANRIGWC